MNRIALFALALACSTQAGAATVLFTNSTAFHTASPSAILIENFEDSPVASRDIQLPSYNGPGGEISFIPFSGDPVPNVVIASPGYTNFGAGLNPTTSTILTTSGNEDFTGTLTSSAFSLGFDVLLNDSPLTIAFFNGATLIGTLTFDNPPVTGNNLAFAGITSDTGITSFRLTATNGQNINTGVDNIYTQTTPLAPAVPEPSTWAMMLLGFGAMGMAMRKARGSAACNRRPLGVDRVVFHR